ncbi:MAG: molybdate ABC transporter permease subunit [Cyanobacteria bacterium P01_E01_bin.6]
MPLELSPLWISLRAALLATIFAFLTGIVAARWMMTYRGKIRGLIDGVFTLPLVLPPTVVGFLLLLLLGRNSPVGQLLRHLGMNVIFTWYATVIAATIVAFPLMYKTALGAFEQIETDLLNCARTLGASEWRIFWQLLLPLAWPGIIAGTILSFARALGEFGATLMVAGSIPGTTQTIPITIFFAAEAGRMGEALAWVILMVAVSLGIIGLIHYWSQAHNSRKTRISHAIPLTHGILNVLILGRWRSAWEQENSHSSDDKELDIAPQCWLRSPNSPASSAVVSLVVNIRKRLHGFNLETAFSINGTPMGILGSSGSGKSMTLRCIAGLETPTEGQIILNNRILFDSLRGINVPSRKRRIGVVFQNYALFPHLNVVQNIAFGLQDLPKAERSPRIHYYLNLMHLEGLAHRYPHQLSGGQQQRVALARALAISPDAILLDEPLSALDTHLRSRIEKLLAQVLSTFDGVSLFVTHNLEEVYRVCPNLMVMDEGRAIATGTKYQIFERPTHPRVAKITGCKNFSRAVVRGANLLEARDWNCILETLETVPDNLTQVGIRAHQITFMDVPRYYQIDDEDVASPNIFPCWLAEQSETPHRMTLYLKLNSPPTSPSDYHLQAEVFKEKWAVLKSKPFPWHVQLDPARLILMSE